MLMQCELTGGMHAANAKGNAFVQLHLIPGSKYVHEELFAKV